MNFINCVLLRFLLVVCYGGEAILEGLLHYCQPLQPFGVLTWHKFPNSRGSLVFCEVFLSCSMMNSPYDFFFIWVMFSFVVMSPLRMSFSLLIFIFIVFMLTPQIFMKFSTSEAMMVCLHFWDLGFWCQFFFGGKIGKVPSWKMKDYAPELQSFLFYKILFLLANIKLFWLESLN